MKRRPIIAIDGPAGSGKTTVSKRLAERAGLTRLDTGAMYRACALAARREGISWDDGERLGGLCGTMDLTLRQEGKELLVLLAGEDVSLAIRTPEMSMGASDVSRHGPVRDALVALQRRLGEGGGVVLEGRDTGTVVFPLADVKFFLDADAPVRALRRRRELPPDGRPSFGDVLRDVLRRDVQDCTRDHSPLKVAGDAIYVDSTTLTVEEVVERMVEAVRRAEAGGDGAPPAGGG